MYVYARVCMFVLLVCVCTQLKRDYLGDGAMLDRYLTYLNVRHRLNVCVFDLCLF